MIHRIDLEFKQWEHQTSYHFIQVLSGTNTHPKFVAIVVGCYIPLCGDNIPKNLTTHVTVFQSMAPNSDFAILHAGTYPTFIYSCIYLDAQRDTYFFAKV